MAISETDANKELPSDSLWDQILKDTAPDENSSPGPLDPDGPPQLECPACHARQVLPIVYGFPNSRELDQAIQGLVALGGCCLCAEAPMWRCPSCQCEWGRLFQADKQSRLDYRIMLAWIEEHYQPTPEERIRERQHATERRLYVQPFLDQVLPQAAQQGAQSVRIELRKDGARLYFVGKNGSWLMHETGGEEVIVSHLRSLLQEQGKEASYTSSWIEIQVGDEASRLHVAVADLAHGTICSVRSAGLQTPALAAGGGLALRATCPYCGEPLRTDRAKQCHYCKMDWHDPDRVFCSRRA